MSTAIPPSPGHHISERALSGPFNDSTAGSNAAGTAPPLPIDVAWQSISSNCFTDSPGRIGSLSSSRNESSDVPLGFEGIEEGVAHEYWGYYKEFFGVYSYKDETDPRDSATPPTHFSKDIVLIGSRDDSYANIHELVDGLNTYGFYVLPADLKKLYSVIDFYSEPGVGALNPKQLDLAGADGVLVRTTFEQRKNQFGNWNIGGRIEVNEEALDAARQKRELSSYP